MSNIEYECVEIDGSEFVFCDSRPTKEDRDFIKDNNLSLYYMGRGE